MHLVSNRVRLADGGKSSGANQTATYAHRYVASQLNLNQMGIYL